ncbi:MAG: XRE family transcriptional regulator [Formosimonas sp.]
MSFASNFKIALKHKGQTQSQAAQRLDVSDNTLSNWLNKGVMPSWDNLEKCAQLVGMSVQELLFGTTELTEQYVEIPEYNIRFSAGHGAMLFEESAATGTASYREDWFIKERLNPKRCVRARVQGTSMQGILWDGDIVLINRDETAVIDGKIYALRIGEELYIKRLQKIPGGTLKLQSENPDYDDVIVNLSDDVEIIGRIRDKTGRGGL